VSTNQKLIIIGAGGYSKSVLDSLDGGRFTLSGFIDERMNLCNHLGYPVLGHSLEDIRNASQYVYFIAIGNNKKRKYWHDLLKKAHLHVINVIDSTAIVSPMATIGEGCFVGKYAVVNAGATVGDDVVVNTMALVEHGCVICDHANLSTKSVVNGDVTVGEGCFIGSNSVTIGQRSIGDWTIVGAGATVIHNAPSGVTLAGVPARIVREEAIYW
jgi:sugar O-acyltransferase (sialic acid O-acetyltransferase NeuD family)